MTSLIRNDHLSPSDIAIYYTARLPSLKQRGKEWRGPCPIHKGEDDNFSVNAENGLWYCHSACGRGGSVYDLEMELTKTDFTTAAREVHRIVGPPDVEPMVWGLPNWSYHYLLARINDVERGRGWTHTAIYPYFDVDGRLSYVKVRFIDKDTRKAFRQWAVSSKGGWVARRKAGKEPLLYQRNTLNGADEIFVVNGEKAADRGAHELGIVTTCAPDGEGKWCIEYTRALAGKLVRVVIDRDEKGEAHGKLVAEEVAPHAREVKIIRLPGLPPKGDLWDWIEAGGTREQLKEIVDKTPVELPPADNAQSDPAQSRPLAAGANGSCGNSTNGSRRRGLPTIQTNQRQLRDLTLDCMLALREGNEPPFLFVRGGAWVHIASDETGALSIKPVAQSLMRNFLSEHADFYSNRKNGPVNVAPPRDAVEAVLASAAPTLDFPPLEGIIHAPSLRLDGSVIHLLGYDRRSRLYYSPAAGLQVPEIPEMPTSDHVSVAVDLLRDLLDDFPFANRASFANAMAAILTLVLRPAIAGPAPVVLIDAPMQGSGKSLLANLVSIIATGSAAPMFSMPKEPEEWRKQLTAIVLAGLPYAVFDNLNARLEAGEFCKVVTEGRHADRILGASQLVDMPARTIWAATGNNIQLGGDMARRCYSIRIEPSSANPFLRDHFKYPNLQEHTRQRRGELLAGILAMACAWFNAGQPSPRLRPLGGFERWSVVIGGILEYAGVEGFLANSHALYEEADEEGCEWEVFFQLLRQAFSREFTVAQVWHRMHPSPHAGDDVLASDLRAALPAALQEYLDRGEGAFRHRLGMKFRELQGRRFGKSELRLERAQDDKHTKSARWKLLAKGDIELSNTRSEAPDPANGS